VVTNEVYLCAADGVCYRWTWQRYGSCLLASVTDILTDIKDEGAVLVCRVSRYYYYVIFDFYHTDTQCNIYVQYITHSDGRRL